MRVDEVIRNHSIAGLHTVRVNDVESHSGMSPLRYILPERSSRWCIRKSFTKSRQCETCLMFLSFYQVHSCSERPCYRTSHSGCLLTNHATSASTMCNSSQVSSSSITGTAIGTGRLLNRTGFGTKWLNKSMLKLGCNWMSARGGVSLATS